MIKRNINTFITLIIIFSALLFLVEYALQWVIYFK